MAAGFFLNFDPTVRAFCYVCVLEIPTLRWSTGAVLMRRPFVL